jgi:hypothetical protein
LTLSVVAASLLTVALLVFFSVLLPAASNVAVHRRPPPRVPVDRASTPLEARLQELGRVVRVKRLRLNVAITVSGLAIVVLAVGAVVSLLPTS